jgi:hypothetical protein
VDVGACVAQVRDAVPALTCAQEPGMGDMHPEVQLDPAAGRAGHVQVLGEAAVLEDGKSLSDGEGLLPGDQPVPLGECGEIDPAGYWGARDVSAVMVRGDEEG